MLGTLLHSSATTFLSMLKIFLVTYLVCLVALPFWLALWSGLAM